MKAKKVVKAVVVSEPKTKVVLHERTSAGPHRIVVVENGVPDASGWYEFREVAHHRGLCAATEFYSPALPTGVFRAASVAHQRLGEPGA